MGLRTLTRSSTCLARTAPQAQAQGQGRGRGQEEVEEAVKKRLGSDVEVNWSDIRVICIAPNYKPFDVHAAQVMGANLELWEYRLYTNNSLYLEAIKALAYLLYPRGLDSMYMGAMEPF